MVLARLKGTLTGRIQLETEFTQTPRGLSATGIAMLPGTNKSKMIHALEKLADYEATEEQTTFSAIYASTLCKFKHCCLDSLS